MTTERNERKHRLLLAALGDADAVARYLDLARRADAEGDPERAADWRRQATEARASQMRNERDLGLRRNLTDDWRPS
jgi:rubrerythrin